MSESRPILTRATDSVKQNLYIMPVTAGEARPSSLPLDRGRWLPADIVNNTTDAFDLVAEEITKAVLVVAQSANAARADLSAASARPHPDRPQSSRE